MCTHCGGGGGETFSTRHVYLRWNVAWDVNFSKLIKSIGVWDGPSSAWYAWSQQQ